MADSQATDCPVMFKLPNELFDIIISHLQKEDLKALRHAINDRYESLILRRLFDTLVLSPLKRDHDSFVSIAAQPKLAQNVERLVWYNIPVFKVKVPSPDTVDFWWKRSDKQALDQIALIEQAHQMWWIDLDHQFWHSGEIPQRGISSVLEVVQQLPFQDMQRLQRVEFLQMPSDRPFSLDTVRPDPLACPYNATHTPTCPCPMTIDKLSYDVDELECANTRTELLIAPLQSEVFRSLSSSRPDQQSSIVIRHSDGRIRNVNPIEKNDTFSLVPLTKSGLLSEFQKIDRLTRLILHIPGSCKQKTESLLGATLCLNQLQWLSLYHAESLYEMPTGIEASFIAQVQRKKPWPSLTYFKLTNVKLSTTGLRDFVQENRSDGLALRFTSCRVTRSYLMLLAEIDGLRLDWITIEDRFPCEEVFSCLSPRWNAETISTVRGWSSALSEQVVATYVYRNFGTDYDELGGWQEHELMLV